MSALRRHHMQRPQHLVMSDPAELRAVDVVVTRPEGLEPVDVFMARDRVDLQVEGGEVKRVGHVGGPNHELYDLTHLR